MDKKIKIIVAIVIVVLLVAMIFVLDNNVKEDKKGKVNIVTTFYPMYIATLNITDGVDNVEVSNIASNAVGCLHDYTLTAQNMIAIQNADVIIANGLGMEESIEYAFKNYTNLEVINAGNNINVIDEENAHVFASIKLYMQQIENIADGLKRVDKMHSEQYEQNKNSYIAKLQELFDFGETTLAVYNGINICALHDAIPYIATDYNLKLIAMLDTHEDVEPSTNEITQFVDDIKENGVDVMFVAKENSNKLGNTISRETGAKLVEINTFVSGEMDKDSYINQARENILIIDEALKGE